MSSRVLMCPGAIYVPVFIKVDSVHTHILHFIMRIIHAIRSVHFEGGVFEERCADMILINVRAVRAPVRAESW